MLWRGSNRFIYTNLCIQYIVFHILPFPWLTNTPNVAHYQDPVYPSVYHVQRGGRWRTHDIDDIQFVVHLELEGEVAMGVGVDSTPLLHRTHHHHPTILNTSSYWRNFPCIQQAPQAGKKQARRLEPSGYSVSCPLPPLAS